MLNLCEITDIFYLCDEFSIEFDKMLPRHLLKEDNGKKHRNKPSAMADSEVMAILISFHLSQVRNLKAYYLGYVCKHLNKEFPKLYRTHVKIHKKILIDNYFTSDSEIIIVAENYNLDSFSESIFVIKEQIKRYILIVLSNRRIE